MYSNEKSRAPKWFWALSIIALLWNLMGVISYLATAFMKQEMIADFTEAQKNLVNAQPAWVTAAYATAVFAGVLGSIGLLMRKKWATTMFLVSLLAVVAQTFYNFFMTNATEIFPVFEGMVMPLMILVIAALLFIFARIAGEKQWLV